MTEHIARWRIVWCFLFGHRDVSAGGGLRFRIFECTMCTRTRLVSTKVWRVQRKREQRRK